jgi:hypothetical protein
MPRSTAFLMLPAAALASSALLGGCSIGSVHGVEINNTTDRIVRVELLQLRKTGEMTVYSTQMLGPGGAFKNKVDSEERRSGMRVRMMLEGQTVGDANWVMLNLPDSRDRVYDLTLVGNRLSAREQSKGKRVKTWE